MHEIRVQSDSSVLAHAVAFRAAWWRRYVEPPWWPASLECLPECADRPGYHRLARQDLFDLAADPSPQGRVRLLVAVYAWGTGRSAFLVGRRARTFTKTAPLDLVGERLVRAADLLTTSGPVAAYQSMLPRQPNHVKYLGPAFFTKYLYFTAGFPTAVKPQPLILDKYVALALNRHYGWSLRTTGWSSSDYGRYLDLAAEKAQAAGPGHSAAGFEMALFESA